MILVPELETVVILVPRTGSGSLRRAIARAYPRSILLYRHMEADGVPPGYDRWRKVGVLRDPLDRLWSLYKFLKQFGGDHDQAYIESMRASVRDPFDIWLRSNQTVFTSPYDSAGYGRFFPQYTVRHPVPENWKSQFVYLRPDLGTEVIGYSDLDVLAARLKVELPRENVTTRETSPPLSGETRNHLNRVFKWDWSALQKTCSQHCATPPTTALEPAKQE